ncbi:MAG: DNA-directed RNA polymerase subunit beta, partial [Candidatus Doudnabacteria bacterium]|nr:DNA-directed RNA polymerase subunit beta [Candidatus Doudnabacteria bacterium]
MATTPTRSQLSDRVFFSEPRDAMELPDLVRVQLESYEWFFEQGLKELMEEISPIEDWTGKSYELTLDTYELDPPKVDEVMARSRNSTFEAALRVKVRLTNKITGEIKEQEVYLGEFPVMTDRGTFIINGVERVVVSQLIRSPGAFFVAELSKGKKNFGAKIIPNRGAWLEFETDNSGAIFVKVDRKRKVAATSLLRAFGYGSNQQIIEALKDVDTDPSRSYVEATLAKDVADSEEEGFKEVYKRIRPGDLATADNAKSLIESMFYNFDRYDLGRVGRFKANQRLGLNIPNTKEGRVLHPEDLIATIREIIRLNATQGEPDDIDHLGNRRVRSVGELIQNKMRVGLMRMERIVKDRMSTMDMHTLTPSALINARPVIASIREFFMSSQLSQFMDQTNPLSELAHKRRFSAMGPGGLSRERAGFDVRDVHRTHYGRICPIATPEGPNIGLVGHLASFSRINDLGFIETPYRKVIREFLSAEFDKAVGEISYKSDQSDEKGKIVIPAETEITKAHVEAAKKAGLDRIRVRSRVSDDVVYLDAFAEELSVTTPATTPTDEKGYFTEKRAECRIHGEPQIAATGEIEYMDVSPRQVVSITTSLIPFLEHDDANRALMGTNMQRQAVPCIRPDSPMVGTGVEGRVARDSFAVIVAEKPGTVTKVNGGEVVVKEKGGEERSYFLKTFERSNTSTSINQIPVVDVGDELKEGQLIADGAATQGGELAIGQNMLVAFLSLDGGTFEDSILISDRVVQGDYYTSVHIEEFTIDVRDTKLGPEVLTRDIPNVGEEKLKDLDEEGIIRIGAEVGSGDILVGKITPKGETELTAEERLLRAIFGEKAKDVKDSSLYLRHGEHGKVVDVKIFTREQGDKLSMGVIKTVQISVAQMRKIQVGDKMAGRHGNKGVVSRVVSVEDMPHLEDGTPVDILLNPLGIASRMNIGQILEIHLGLAA